MPDPLQTLAEIAERCREAARSFNPSRGPALAADVAELVEIVQGVAKEQSVLRQRLLILEKNPEGLELEFDRFRGST